MDLGISTENFFNQFESLSNLAQEVPIDAKAIDKQRVGSLLLSAVPLEGLGIQALASSSIGQSGIAAIKTIGSKIASVVEEGVENLSETISSRFSGAGTLGQDAIQSIDTSDLFTTRTAGPPAASAEVEEQVELGNMADVPPAGPGGPALTTETAETTAQAPEELAAPVADIAETTAAAAGETAGEIAAVTASTVLDAIPVVGAVIGLATTIGIAFKDLFDKPHDSAPIYAASQLGV